MKVDLIHKIDKVLAVELVGVIGFAIHNRSNILIAGIMTILETLDLLARQVNLSIDRDDRADLNGALSNMEDALRTLKGLQILMEDHRRNLVNQIQENELHAYDPDEPWYNR